MNHPRLLSIATVALLAFPMVASAQRKGKMGGGDDESAWKEATSVKGLGGPTISAKDFEKVSVFKLILDKKKDLKLTEAQLIAVKEADAKLLAANAARFTMMDSLKKDAKPKTTGTPSAEDEARMVIAREALNGVVSDIRASFDAAAKEPVPTLDETQQKLALAMMEQYNEHMQEMLREKLGGRGAGGGGAPPAGRGRGGRPPLS